MGNDDFFCLRDRFILRERAIEFMPFYIWVNTLVLKQAQEMHRGILKQV